MKDTKRIITSYRGKKLEEHTKEELIQIITEQNIRYGEQLKDKQSTIDHLYDVLDNNVKEYR